MLVEDDPNIALGVTATLESFGYSVCPAITTGEEAVARAIELNPDVILMDINLRGPMDGVEATQAINANSITPIIYLSAQAGDATRRDAKLTRNYGYLLKPFNPDELREAIEMTFRLVRGIRGAAFEV